MLSPINQELGHDAADGDRSRWRRRNNCGRIPHESITQVVGGCVPRQYANPLDVAVLAEMDLLSQGQPTHNRFFGGRLLIRKRHHTAAIGVVLQGWCQKNNQTLFDPKGIGWDGNGRYQS